MGFSAWADALAPQFPGSVKPQHDQASAPTVLIRVAAEESNCRLREGDAIVVSSGNGD